MGKGEYSTDFTDFTGFTVDAACGLLDKVYWLLQDHKNERVRDVSRKAYDLRGELEDYLEMVEMAEMAAIVAEKEESCGSE